jgi:hypothetical protein
LVLLLEVMEHLERNAQERVLTELARVARRYMLITVPWQQRLVPALVRCPDCRGTFHVSGHVREFFSETDISAPSGFALASFNLLVVTPRSSHSEMLVRLAQRLGAYYAPKSHKVYCENCSKWVYADPTASSLGRLARYMSWRFPGLLRRKYATETAGWAGWLFERTWEAAHVGV